MKDFIRHKVRQMLTESRIPFDLKVPTDILAIKDVFKKNGYKLYIVGGAVRDALLHKTPKDFDLATDAVPDTVEKILAENGFKTLPTGKAFGVINVFTDQGEYEIATFRVDIGSGRRPDSVQFSDIETDVKRRDLTINALFYDIDTREIVDLVGGVDDLKNGVVRTVGQPQDRFGEDRLRILRAVRFAGRFGSNLDPEVDAALKTDASLEGISGERIRDEFIKGIKTAKSVVHYLQLLSKYHLFKWIFQGLKVTHDFVENNNEILVIANLLVDNDPSLLNKALNKLKYSIEEIRDIVFLVRLTMLTPENAIALKKAQGLTNLSDELIMKFAQHQRMSMKLVYAFLKFRLTVNGEEVMQQFGLKPGKELGDKIAQLEYNNFLKILG